MLNLRIVKMRKRHAPYDRSIGVVPGKPIIYSPAETYTDEVMVFNRLLTPDEIRTLTALSARAYQPSKRV